MSKPLNTDQLVWDAAGVIHDARIRSAWAPHQVEWRIAATGGAWKPHPAKWSGIGMPAEHELAWDCAKALHKAGMLRL